MTENNVLLLDKRTCSLIDNYVPDGELIERLVGFFTVFADRTRLKMLSALSICEMCVTDLSVILSLNQTTVSHQLRLLKNLGAVNMRRAGKVVFYSLKSEMLADMLLKGIEFLSL